MKTILTIARKEVLGYFSSPVGYVFAGLMLLVANWLFFQDFFVANQANLAPLWNSLGFLLSLFVPALSMNALSEEKKNGNWEVILSLPVSETQMVLGKFLGLLFCVGVSLLLFLPTVGVVFYLGKPDTGVMAGGALGVLFMAVTYLAIGIFASALSNQAVVGFMVAMIFLLVNSFMGQDSILSRFPPLVSSVIGYLSISWHANRFADGLVQGSDVVFFVSFCAIFLILTVMWLKARNK
ncbi:ABC transporter permease [Patescibacteria group bacterium]|nr:ABC transporter permease [Patescibacteria group bacterium]